MTAAYAWLALAIVGPPAVVLAYVAWEVKRGR